VFSERLFPANCRGVCYCQRLTVFSQDHHQPTARRNPSQLTAAGQVLATTLAERLITILDTESKGDANLFLL
jgi:hypothetical protein